MEFHFHANKSQFHKNGFALRLALKQRHKGTRKWPILTFKTIFCLLEKICLWAKTEERIIFIIHTDKYCVII